ncbi:type II toxin-antitoxin system VapC family toxin [Kineococcus radiotolerans]|uniref:Ribonuclease VapC n=1 Tax=Kineococcus radiotolerans (strain ATCC BAA-149 / DSM 14245 / SRS30216) TaxID=266940 RepID=A6W4V5_KINRD|nr:PIN domain-containing protein [Kineococcus radiotolerans]ABS01844.1 PilT protein domain protein [Kineococcus radiotolerans SRS30216 = ATCC BAA-149]
MTNLLLDTNAVITMAAAPPGTTFAGIQDGDVLAISTVTELEVRLGVGLRPGNVHLLQTLAWLTRNYRGIPTDAAVVAAFPVIVASAVAAGQSPERRIADLTIAATALAHGATLITDDRTLRNALTGAVATRSLQ